MSVGKSRAWTHGAPALPGSLLPTLDLSRVSARIAPPVGAGIGIAFFTLSTWLMLAHYDTYHIYYRDFSIYVNTLWNTANGYPFSTSLLLKNRNHLAEHVAPLLLVLAPIFRVVPDPRILIVVQQGALALAGLPVYLLARRKLGGPWTPVLVLAAFYLAPNLAQVNVLRGFYPVAVSAVPIAFGAYLILTDRPKPGAAIALSALLIEETASLSLLGLGALLVLRRQVRLGLLVSGLAAAWIAVLALFLMPSFHLEITLPETGNRTLHKYRNVMEDPAQFVQMVRDRGPEAARWLLLPTGGLPLLAPFTLVAALPTVGALLFQIDDSLQTHRIAPAIPLLWLATVQGLAALRGGWRLKVALVLMLALSVAAFVRESPLPGGGHFEPWLVQRDEITDAMARAVDTVPPGASLAGTSNLMSHLSGRREMYAFPGKYSEGLWPQDRVEWFVLDVKQDFLLDEILADRRSPLRDRDPYALWFIHDTVLVASDVPVQMLYPANFRFGAVFRLEGYEVESLESAVRIRLRWRTTSLPQLDFDRSLEVLDANGRTVVSHLGPNSREYHPTSDWKRRQVVVEEVTLPLDRQVDLSTATLRLRWSESESGRRLDLEDGRGFLDLPIP